MRKHTAGKLKILFLLAFLPISVVQAQPLQIYDNFSANQINSAKWEASRGGDDGRLEHFRRIVRGGLMLRHRAYAEVSTEGGIDRSRFGLRMPETSAENVDRMLARVRLDGVGVVGCPASEQRSLGGLRLEGYWLNDGSGSEETGDTGTIWAALRVARSDSDPAGIARVTAQVFRCANEDCSAGETLLDERFANLRIRKWYNVEINHDKDRTGILFKAAGKRTVWNYGALGISASDVPGFHFKAIRNISDLANCGIAVPLPVADVRSRVDWVRVNR